MAAKRKRKSSRRVDAVRQQAKQTAFLEAFALVGNVSRAAALVPMARDSHYGWMASEIYAARFKAAEGQFADSIREEVRRRAIDGWDEPVVYQGRIARANHKPVTVRKFSDRLLELLAKAKCDEFRERQEITGKDGGPLEVDIMSRLRAGRDRLFKRNA